MQGWLPSYFDVPLDLFFLDLGPELSLLFLLKLSDELEHALVVESFLSSDFRSAAALIGMHLLEEVVFGATGSA